MNMNVNELHPKEDVFVEVRNCQVGIHFNIFDPSIVLQSIFDLPILWAIYHLAKGNLKMVKSFLFPMVMVVGCVEKPHVGLVARCAHAHTKLVGLHTLNHGHLKRRALARFSMWIMQGRRGALALPSASQLSLHFPLVICLVQFKALFGSAIK
jgi:hypothetical protein